MAKTTQTSVMPAPGETIDGRFRIERVVGQGGMGVVVDAVNLRLDQHVALKFLRPDVERSAEVVARFEREVRSAVKLRSEHVARVSDVGSHPALGPYMVMELLEGSTLAEIIVSTGPLPLHRAAEYVIHACEGLAEAHMRGIVHQDVKPANLFLVRGSDGRPLVKVLDFGISKLTTTPPGERPDFTASTTGRSGNIGTPHYLSPEQLRSGVEVDRRADVWALGCVLFELVTGVKAFTAPRFTGLVAAILEAPRAAIPADIELPPALVEVIDRCLEKDRELRYGTTAELGLALLPFARRRAHAVASRAVAHVNASGDHALQMPSSMPPPPGDSTPSLPSGPMLRAPRVPEIDSTAPPRGSSAPPAPAQAPAQQPPSQRLTVLLLLALLLLLVGAGIALLFSSRTPAPAIAATSASIAASSAPAIRNAPSIDIGTSSAATETTDAPAASATAPPSTTRRPLTVGTRPTVTTAPAPLPAPAVPEDGEIRRTR